jgi:hypothetical protein
MTGSDFPQFCDSSGSIIGVEVRSIQASSVLFRLYNVISGLGNVCDDIVVTGAIRGQPGTNEAVRIGDDSTEPQTTGGTYGLIDLGTVAPYPSANLTGSGAAIINLYSPAADTVKARIDYGDSQYAPTYAVQVTGTSTATIGQLDLGGRFNTAGASSLPYIFAYLNAASATVNYTRLTGVFMNSGPGTNGGLLVLGSGVTAGQADILGCQCAWPSNSSGTGAVVLKSGAALSNLNFSGGTFGPCIAAVNLGGSANAAISFSGGIVVTGTQYVAFCGGSGGTYTFAVDPSAVFTGITVADWHAGSGTFLFTVFGEGSSGEVLTSNGASALPSWQPAAGGGSVPNVGLPPSAFGLAFLTSLLGNANSRESPGGIVCLGTAFTVGANVTLSSRLGVFITGIGSSAGGTNAIGIYSLSAGTWTKLGATGDMSTALTTGGNIWVTGSLSGSISLTAGTIYAAVINLNFSGNPSFAVTGPGAAFPVINGIPAGGFYFSGSSLPSSFTQASVTMDSGSLIFGGA